MCFKWPENSVRFENPMGIGFQKGQNLFISQCEVWHVCWNLHSAWGLILEDICVKYIKNHTRSSGDMEQTLIL